MAFSLLKTFAPRSERNFCWEEQKLLEFGLVWVEFNAHSTQYRSFRMRSSQPITWLVLANKTVQENTDKQTQYKSEKVNNWKCSKTKLPWFSCLLQHSSRKRGGLILQCSRAHMGRVVNFAPWNCCFQQKRVLSLFVIMTNFSSGWHLKLLCVCFCRCVDGWSQSVLYYYYVLLRQNGSKTYSSIQTHTVINANTSTKKTQKDNNSKTVKRNRADKTRGTLGLLNCAGDCPIQPALLFAGWHESMLFKFVKLMWPPVLL